jgi:hypothetical protein
MEGQKKTIERRKNKRYKAIEGAYASIRPNQKLGQINDISIGGVSFKYIDTSNDNQKSGTHQEDSMFLFSRGYSIRDLHFKTVGDYEITNEPSFSSMEVRKRHVQFIDINFKQLFDLDNYIRNNTSEQN